MTIMLHHEYMSGVQIAHFGGMEHMDEFSDNIMEQNFIMESEKYEQENI